MEENFNTSDFIAKLKKELEGVSTITKLSDPANEIKRCPTGILLLDWIAGGGIPRGRWVEIFGKESGGKSLLASLICATAQKRGELVAWIDMERTADASWFKRIGVDTDNMILAKPTSAEDAFRTMNTLVETGKIPFIVVDSVASMASEGELEDDPGKQNMAIMARMISTEMRKLTGKLDAKGVTIILINQLRSTMAVTKYMKQETTTGGKAIPFYASLRLAVHKLTDAKSYVVNKDGEMLAHSLRIKAEKNKVGSPGKVGEFMFIYDGGPDNRAALVALAQTHKYITQKGSMYYIDYNGQTISAKGAKEVIRIIEQNTDLQNFLFDALNIDPVYRDMFKTSREVISAEGIAEVAELPEGTVY